MNNVLAASCLAASVWIPSVAMGQWATDPASTLKVADTTGEQVQPKLARTSDGGTYISWYDSGSINFKNDTWTWNGTAWTRLSPAAASPPSRFKHAMAYDDFRQKTVLFGGSNPGGVLGDTWEWDGAAWAQRAVASPPARQMHCMAYDQVRGEVVLFGGLDGSGTILGETWTFNGSNWVQRAPAHSPPARKMSAMAYDMSRAVTVLFGGADGANFLQDTWEWNGTDWTQVVTATLPPARSEHVVVFDTRSGPRALLFGGQDTSGTMLNDTWLYDGVDWALQAPATSPNARGGAAGAISPTAASGLRLVVFGGNSGTFNLANLYEWNSATPPVNWIQKNPSSSPSARKYLAMAYDAARNNTVLFGGVDQGGYDVYLQRLNAAGVEQWPHGGIQICDRNFSSTTDYGLTCDGGDNAVIVFNDDRFATGKITAQKVSPAGALLWNGIIGNQIGDGPLISSPPSVALLSDGNYGFIWNNSSSPVGTIRQKVDANTGSPLWGAAGLTQIDSISPQRPLQASDVIADNAGGMIALFVRCTGTNCVLSNKLLYAQRYDSTGAALWNGGAPLPVFTANSIQTGAFPRMLSDGAGGALIPYYETGGSRNAYIAHVLASGAIKAGSPFASAPVAGRARVSAAAAYDLASGNYFLAAAETNASTTNTDNNIVAQKFDSTGAPQWGASGLTLYPIGAPQPNFVGCQTWADGCIVVYQELSTGTSRTVKARRIAGDASQPWGPDGVFINSDGSNDKSRLTSTRSTQGFIIAGFGWGNSGSVDIAAARLNGDGTQGPRSGPAACSLADIATAGNSNPQAGPDGFITGEDADLFVIAFNTLLRRDFDDTFIGDMTDGTGTGPPDGFVTGTDADYFVIKYFIGC